MGTLINLLIPGTGLILLGREWLGALLAVVFGICGQIALAGWLIAPAAVPRGLVVVAVIVAGLTWIASQAMYQRLWFIQRRSDAETSGGTPRHPTA